MLDDLIGDFDFDAPATDFDYATKEGWRQFVDFIAQRPLTLTMTEYDTLSSPSERSVPVGGFVRSYLSLQGTTFDTANRFTNKAAMKRALQEADVPTANWRQAIGIQQVHDAALALGFPVIVKPAYGTATMNSFVLHTTQDLAELPEAAPTLFGFGTLLIVEEFLTVGRELNCDGVVIGGRAVATVCSSYTRPVLGAARVLMGGYTLPQGTELEEELLHLHDATVRALGMQSGVTHMEVLSSPRGLLVGEIACRPGGAGVSRNAFLARGLDIWSAFYAESLGWDVSSVLANFHDESGVHFWAKLPIETGTVGYVSPPDELMRLPGMIEVDLHLVAGDRVGTRIHSASTAGLVYMRLPDAEESTIRSALELIDERFGLTMLEGVA